jgi:biopolymer transport protein ExbD
MGKGQVWSIDILLAVVIFVSVILIFYVTMVPRQKPQMKDLEAESGALKLELEKNNEFGFLIDDEVNDAKLQAFIDNATANYSALKKKLGVKGEFCLFYEDSEGNVVPIGSNNLVGVGNSSIIVAGDNCSSIITSP